MEGEQRCGGDAGPQRVGVEQAGEGADEAVPGVDGYAPKDIAPGHPPQEGGDEAAEEDGPVPEPPPRRCPVLAPELEGDAAHDEGDDDQEQREVEAAEHRGVPLGEGGERGPSGHDQPHLVGVPERADGIDDHPPLPVVPADHRQQDSHAEVEPLEEEVAGPEHGDEREPGHR